MTINVCRFLQYFRNLSCSAILVLAVAIFFSPIWTTQAAISIFDNFDDGQTDTTKWKRAVLTRGASQYDSAVLVAETGGRLTITPRVKASNRSYNGYVSLGSVNLTDARAEIEVVNIASSKAETMFALGQNDNNFFRFRAKGTTLYLESAVNGTTDRTDIAYSKTEHRFWRIRHLAQTDQIVFETSSNQTAWSAKKTVARSFAVTNLFVEITAGTSTAVGIPGKAEFDNFVVATSDTTPTPTPTVTPTPTTSPSPTPTTSPSPTPTPTPTPTPGLSNSRGYLTTPGELAQIRQKASQNVEPYKTAVSSLISKAGTPTSWSHGTVDPTNRDLLHAASANLYAKAMAYHLTGNDQYAAFVRQKLLEITSTNTCPNEYSGGNGCILTLSRHIPAYVSAADLIADYPGWTAADKQAFQVWLRDKVYRFTDWASDARSTNWGSVGTAATIYVADYFAGSNLNLIDRSGTAFTASQAFAEARQRAIDRNNGNSYMYNSVCSDTTGLGIQYYGGIPEETGRDTTGCWGTYLLTNDSSYSYMIAHLSGTLPTAELLLRRGDRTLYDNIKADGGGSILRAILYVIENPYDPDPPKHSYDWLSSRKSILEIAYRYYRHPAIARQLGIGTGSRNIDGDGNSAMPHFGTLTHGFAASENPGLPPVTPAP